MSYTKNSVTLNVITARTYHKSGEILVVDWWFNHLVAVARFRHGMIFIWCGYFVFHPLNKEPLYIYIYVCARKYGDRFIHRYLWLVLRVYVLVVPPSAVVIRSTSTPYQILTAVTSYTQSCFPLFALHCITVTTSSRSPAALWQVDNTLKTNQLKVDISSSSDEVTDVIMLKLPRSR